MAEVRPFPVDPEVMARIRPFQHRDAADVARLHAAAMGRSTWARLGEGFLAELYRCLVDSPRFLAFVYEEPREDGPGRRVRGFIAGSTDTAAMMEETWRRHRVRLAVAALPGLARHPLLVPRLLTTGRYGRRAGQVADVPGESLFCSFEPELRGRRIAGHINKVLFDELLARGHDAVRITTEADNAPAIRQLRSWGFEERGRFRFYGKEMITFVLDLRTSPRVEPVSRHPAV